MTAALQVLDVAARTPVGLQADSSAAAVRAGISCVAEHPFLADAYGEPVIVGCDAELDVELGGIDRLQALLMSCLERLAIAAASLARDGFGKCQVFLAVPEERPGFSKEDQRALLAMLASSDGDSLGPMVFRVVGRGHAGGFSGLECALEEIAAGRLHYCIVAGVDSCFDGATLEWLEVQRKLLTRDARSGFAPGEGAAALLLGSEAASRHSGTPSLGRLRAAATAEERRRKDSDAGSFGEALCEVYSRVTETIRNSGEQVDDLYCDINDERDRTTELAFAMLRLGGLFRENLTYQTPVASVGDVGAASAVLNCVLAICAWSRGYASGPRALISGASWAGLRGAALMEYEQ